MNNLHNFRPPDELFRLYHLPQTRWQGKNGRLRLCNNDFGCTYDGGPYGLCVRGLVKRDTLIARPDGSGCKGILHLVTPTADDGHRFDLSTIALLSVLRDVNDNARTIHCVRRVLGERCVVFMAQGDHTPVTVKDAEGHTILPDEDGGYDLDGLHVDVIFVLYLLAIPPHYQRDAILVASIVEIRVHAVHP
ncbi:hypothetical protein BDN72DRAFT_899336 [Pluteus cervinus]|uniref:Uncharacterized protein n=1 Tax=Pluteus cervinus TaxID=181527 RepID=A0ACD3APZ8_9AGAR|nr:hypothetical protein BDN72DRAFT_899336 [Pluteus cervinus]